MSWDGPVSAVCVCVFVQFCLLWREPLHRKSCQSTVLNLRNTGEEDRARPEESRFSFLLTVLGWNIFFFDVLISSCQTVAAQKLFKEAQDNPTQHEFPAMKPFRPKSKIWKIQDFYILFQFFPESEMDEMWTKSFYAPPILQHSLTQDHPQLLWGLKPTRKKVGFPGRSSSSKPGFSLGVSVGLHSRGDMSE